MSSSFPVSEVPIRPHAVSAGEVVPGDLFALSAEDAELSRWYVVVHTVPESPEAIRVVYRPVLGGSERELVVGREERVVVGGRRVDPESVPLLETEELAAVTFRDGDRVRVLRVVDPGAVEVTYVRRWGVWHRDLDGSDAGSASDGDVREWARRAEEDGVVVRYLPRPDAGGASVPRARRVVVTGLGAVTPLGVGVGELWEGLVEGRHGIRELEGEEFEGLPVRVAGTVPVDPVSLLDRTAARRMNRAAQFAVLAAREAWGDAGFEAGGTEAAGVAPERVGVSLGAILGDASVLVGGDRRLRERGPRGVSPLTTPMTVPSQAASQVSLDLHITGEARTVTSACASGTEAIGEAIDRIRYGRVDVALAGGAEAVVTPAIMASFAAMRALSQHGVEGALSPSRPFAKDRNGFVNGEGAGVLVLEAEEHALARGARIYCEAAGWGLSADAHHMAAPDPSGKGVARALRGAVRDAGGHLVDVVHVNAHATATTEGDLAEAAALRGVFGERAVPVTALKGHLGHLQGAAGGVEAVAAVLTLHRRLIPPTVGCAEVDDDIRELGVEVVTGGPRELPDDGDLVLSNSFGFGGHNAVLALRRV
ncbi:MULTISPECIES: beta-ketoacyl-[acyl-carrier-protein] synthase family protein [Streptomyces]|uniref:3-oxoacyl-ACP synthase n=2 Tax=Streptomyces TaxID=1883 RepID=A0A2U9P8R0_STRAS|nr:beta-ketoacyl-[acyl-carrier-protein] synthase family protein [Streptomyces actuosus]AWT45485.1 3-oxoacyl-ACP synthase [Streptomyces actuosus]MBM4822106.1 beta-ketoacyl-[acyl-carrier-protein] synthase family protein [Streptomyces actuosus]